MRTGFFKPYSIRTVYKNRAVTIDTFGDSAIFTRIHTFLKNKDNYYYKITNKSSHHGFEIPAGCHQYKTNCQDLDGNYIIYCSNEEKIKKMFENQNILLAIVAQIPYDGFTIELRNSDITPGVRLPKEITELHLHLPSLITDLTHLESLYSLFCELIDHY